MADTVLTLTQIENLFQSVTSQILGTSDPSAVRISWPKDGAPGWEIDQDVCFIMVNYDDDPITRQMETSYDSLDANDAAVNVSYTVVVRVSWTIYGPNSFDNADLIRSRLFQSPYTDTFTSNNLALITDVPPPVRVPELLNGEWWNRTSFYAKFNELVIRQSSAPYLQTANIQTQEG